MKIEELHLSAFGHFTDHIIDFSPKNFSILYGANEAGKSTTLRAIRQVLYGIDARSSDNFLHSHQDMRIGVRIKSQRIDGDGERLWGFLRRKGNKNTLTDLDHPDQLVPESTLEALLNHVDENRFQLLFGLDYHALVEGGREIVEGKGDIGESLFSAGGRIARLPVIRKKLEEEASRIFVKGGSSKEVHLLLKRLKENEERLKAFSLSPDKYHGMQEELALKEKLVESNRTEWSENNKKKEHLQRLRGAVQIRQELKQAEREREEFKSRGQVMVPLGFQERRKQIFALHDKVSKELNTLQNSVTLRKEKIESLSKEIVPLFLDYKVEIEGLSNSRELYISNREGFRRICTEIEQEEQLFQVQMKKLNWSKKQLEQLNIARSKQAKIEDVFEKLGHFNTEIQSSEKRIKSTIEKIDEARETLEKLPEIDSLEPLQRIGKKIAAIRGDLQIMERGKQDIKDTENKIESRFKRLPLIADQSFKYFLKTSFPLEDTIEQFIKRASDLKESERELKQERSVFSTHQKRIEKEIQSIQKAKKIYTEEELAQMRSKRDDEWRWIKSFWIEGNAAASDVTRFSTEKPSTDVYEGLVISADKISDEMVMESEKVSKLKLYSEEFEENRVSLANLKDKENSWSEARDEFEKDWEKVWSSFDFDPLTPQEMKEWKSKMEVLFEEHEELQKKQNEVESIQERVESLRREVLEVLVLIHKVQWEEYSDQELFDSAEEELEKQKQNEAVRGDQERSLEREEKAKKEEEVKLSSLKKERAHTLEEKERLLTEMGISPETSKRETDGLLQEAKELSLRVQDLEKKRVEVKELQKQCDAVENQIKQIADVIDEDLTGIEYAVVIQRWKSALDHSLKSQRAWEMNKEELEKEEHHVQAKLKEERDARSECEKLLNEAGVDGVGKLEEVEMLSAQYHENEERIRDLNQRLTMYAGSEGVDKLITEINDIDVDSIASQIEELGQQLVRIEQVRRNLDQEIGALKRELLKIETEETGAADLRQEMEMDSMELEKKIEEYAQLRFAGYLLNKEVKRYQEENQDPILQQAGKIFSKITLGRFIGIQIDYGEGGRLLGVRENKKLVSVSEMSEGTEDQLFLALRLASIQERLKHYAAMPLILDDILIKFDNERARATLEVLEEMSQTMQILYFTHHKHILELAEGLSFHPVCL